MMIRLHYGPNAGELQDIRSDAAHELLRRGVATDPRLEEGELAPNPAVQAEVKLPLPAKPRRGRS